MIVAPIKKKMLSAAAAICLFSTWFHAETRRGNTRHNDREISPRLQHDRRDDGMWEVGVENRGQREQKREMRKTDAVSAAARRECSTEGRELTCFSTPATLTDSTFSHRCSNSSSKSRQPNLQEATTQWPAGLF